jgi:hypothetical protein
MRPSELIEPGKITRRNLRRDNQCSTQVSAQSSFGTVSICSKRSGGS